MKPPALGVITGTLKSTVTRKIRRIKGYENYKIWHRNYYEHVIRDEKDFQRICQHPKFSTTWKWRLSRIIVNKRIEGVEKQVLN